MILTVREMKTEDLTDVAKLEARCFSEPWSLPSLERLLTEEGRALVAVNESGTVLGYVGIWNAPGEGQITNLAVHPSARRMGVGKELMKYLTEHAMRYGYESISLEVRESNLAAVSLYTACGFAPVGRRKRFYKNPAEDAIVMIYGKTVD